MYDPSDMFSQLEEAAETMANAEAMASQLEEMRKPILYDIAISLAERQSMAAAEREAYATEAYETHIKAMTEARRVANRAKARYHNLRAFWDACRTKEASDRVFLSR